MTRVLGFWKELLKWVQGKEQHDETKDDPWLLGDIERIDQPWRGCVYV